MRTGGLIAGALCALATVSFAAPQPLHYSLHEKRDYAPHEWTKHSRANSGQLLPVRIGLKQRNLEFAGDYINDVAHPDSRNYGKHWTAEKVANVFAPAEETVREVRNWLHTSGINAERITLSKGRNWVEFEAKVDEIERLLDTEYHLYKHNTLDGYRVACDQYHVPSTIQHHVDFIMPTIQLDGLKPIPQLLPALVKHVDTSPGLSSGISNCSNILTIDCFRAIYEFGFLNYSKPDNQLGIGEWADYLYHPDLKVFFENFTSPPIPPDTLPEFISIDGGRTSNYTQAKEGNVIESGLDFQLAYSIIWPQQIRQYQVGDGVNVDSVGTFNIFLDALDESYCTYQGGDQPYVDPEYPDPNLGGYTGPLQCGGAPISKVFSFSYNQIEAALPVFYQQRQCHEWMKLALQGVSVFFASGDSGVANRYNSGYNNSCVNSEYRYVDTNGTRFSPSFPPNCPWVTAVGGTMLLTKDIKGGEQTWSQFDPSMPNEKYPSFGSGGGFSDVFALPSYQAEAVTHYLHNYPPPYDSSVYNNSGNSRAYPDVASLSTDILVVYLDQVLAIGGTSASTPTWASLVTLLNEERALVNKGPIGFVNPVFYANSWAFKDITVGSNPGCNTEGFKAAPGWDPATGLGSPNYPKLKKLFLSLP